MIRGTVLKSTGSRYWVKLENGEKAIAFIKGKLRLKDMRATNPVAVGDQVELLLEGDEYLIKKILVRDNYIVRKASNLSREYSVIAANLDRLYLIVTVSKPKTSLGFIDRFLVNAETYHIPVSIVYNKIDLYDTEALAEMRDQINLYENLGYPCFELSALTGDGIDKLKHNMQGLISLFAGHSGVGKSTLLNAIQPGLEITTAEISDLYNKGKHTTTFAEMHELEIGGYVIDSPGIKTFGVIDLEKEEVRHYFPELRALLPNCKFHNCLHLNEPGCAVLVALEKDEIAASRYNSYLSIYETI